MSENASSQTLRAAIHHHQAGRLSQAEVAYREILSQDPDCLDALHYLGMIAHQLGRQLEAVELIGRAAALAPENPAIHSNLGEAYRHLHRLDDAVASFQRALALQPDFPKALSNFGNALVTLGRPEKAVSCFRRAIALQPDFANAHNNLGIALLNQSRFDEAFTCFRQALALKPDFAEAHNNLGGVLKDCGQMDGAVACYRRALAFRPDYPSAHSNLILALQYSPGSTPGLIDAELRCWNQQHARLSVASNRPHDNDRSPERRLRVGYISADFKRHPVAFFLLPLLEAHNRERYHITCYTGNARPDDVTARFQACTDGWRSLVGVSDDEAAARIRADRIDVLVDLSGHTAGNRLLVFARKPAPIQVGYLGYPGATGLDTIDYRLTDPWADPPGVTGEANVEELVRLPETAWCFTPLSGAPPVGEPPAARSGSVTFACFNNFAKVTDDMLRLWARILLQVPRSRFAVKNFAVGSRSVEERLQAFFREHGVSTDRVELIPPQASQLDHLRCYDRVDLALDTFPYHGTTTTCEALWMGVPVITLAGRGHVSRVGVSLLTGVGLPEFVTHSPDTFVESAVAAARDHPRLAAVRCGLRARMQLSPLMDAPRFARNLENAYRVMWRRWCGQSAPTFIHPS